MKCIILCININIVNIKKLGKNSLFFLKYDKLDKFDIQDMKIIVLDTFEYFV